MQSSFNYQDYCNLPYIKFGYDGGRYLYKKWVIDKHGNRVAYKCRKSQNPDLQSTYFINQDKSEVLRLIRIDVDYNKSSYEFKTGNVLNWELIQDKLKQYPQIFEAIEYVTKSTSGTGFHILFGIAPLPLDERTSGAQISARQLQFHLIQIFNELGIGADPAALGLKQDFCTYKNKNNLIFHNEILTKRIEKEAKKSNYLKIDGAEILNKKEPFITNLLKYVEKTVDELEINYRLYPDIRVEKSFSKLFLYLMGLYTPKQIDSESFLIGKKKLIDLNLPYVPAYNDIELHKEEIAKIMGINIRTTNSYFKMDAFHKLFHIQETIDHTVKISCKMSKNVLRQIDRAQKVIASNGSQNRVNLKLLEPFKVQDGERNLAIVNWAIAYKWNGYSELETLEKINLRVTFIPNFETSSSCKQNQIKSTVHSIFSNRKELFGIGKILLPSWMQEDKFFLKRASMKKVPQQEKQDLKLIIKQSNIIVTNSCLIFRPFISSRSFAPCARSSEAFVLSSFSILNRNKKEFSFRVFKFTLEKDPNSQGTSGILIPFKTKESYVKKVDAVTFHHRIGFFYNGKLLLCLVKNQHYKLKVILPKLLTLLGLKVNSKSISIIHMRKNTKAYPLLASQLYNEGTIAINARQICGKRASRAENMNAYFEKRAKALGITLEHYLESVPKSQQQPQNEDKDFDFEIPF